jgi:antirestriction protein ArdC
MTIYDTITQSIIKELEKGVTPWVQPWTSSASFDLPHNAVSQKTYRGVNVLLLWKTAASQGFRNPAWLTFNQAKKLGGFVKKGEKGTHVVYASTLTKKEIDEQTGEEADKNIPFLKSYVVFNVEQTGFLPEHLYRIAESKSFDQAICEVDIFLNNICADVHYGGDSAFYMPTDDFIVLPHPADFENAGHYYATSLHEHGHWTGHPTRLHRDLKGRFGTQTYAAEELVAELTAAFLCAYLKIPGRLRHAEYIASWLELLHQNKRAIFTASAKATEAAEYLRSLGEPEAFEDR